MQCYLKSWICSLIHIQNGNLMGSFQAQAPSLHHGICLLGANLFGLKSVDHPLTWERGLFGGNIGLAHMDLIERADNQ